MQKVILKSKLNPNRKNNTNMMKEILKILNTINWDKLDSASKIENIEENFFNLISYNKEIAKNAYWKFDNILILQGDLYESAFYLTPFLIETLKFSDNVGNVLKLIFQIINSATEEQQYVVYDLCTNSFTYFIPDHNSNTKVPLHNDDT